MEKLRNIGENRAGLYEEAAVWAQALVAGKHNNPGTNAEKCLIAILNSSLHGKSEEATGLGHLFPSDNRSLPEP